MDKELRKLLSTLIIGSPENIRIAKKEIDKLWHKDTKTFQRIAPLVLEIVNEAWNYFPHKILNGLSPAEKVLEYQQMKQKSQNLPN